MHFTHPPVCSHVHMFTYTCTLYDCSRPGVIITGGASSVHCTCSSTCLFLALLHNRRIAELQSSNSEFEQCLNEQRIKLERFVK